MVTEFTDGVRKRLRSRRKALRLSQDALGERIGSAGPYISRLELGSITLRLDLLEQLAEALECDVLDLIPGSGAGDEAGSELIELVDDLEPEQRDTVMRFLRAMPARGEKKASIASKVDQLSKGDRARIDVMIDALLKRD